ncbi:hypothetical protein M1M07_23870 [Rhodococcus sp. HM1]|uniref:hypothetical protein n=1 Tax=Rhodococcus sp. HM1 TaxID=2937759 RepID=UPI00200B263A|nr:hypothetical protein [Rhodococcus sp. HM1]MCK8674136.1 hypothetical protein [Rhodococcus sp. HM1]
MSDRNDMTAPHGLTHDDAHGLTVSFQLNNPYSTAMAALVANDDGEISVGVKAPDGLSEDEAFDLAQLLNHLSAVARLARNLRVSSPCSGTGLPDGLNDDGGRRLDQDSSSIVDSEQLPLAGQDDRLESFDRGGVSFDRLAGINDLPSDDGSIAHDSSPSVDGSGDPTVGDGQVAEGEQPSATDTTGGAA